jgi:hypothetical protein
MQELSESRRSLALAIAEGLGEDRWRPLAQWFRQELDAEGVPRRAPVADWAGALAWLDQARQQAGRRWPEARFRPPIEGLLRSTLRFSRLRGAAVFGGGNAEVPPRTLLNGWARQIADRSLVRVVEAWFAPGRSKTSTRAIPPASYSNPHLPLAILRSEWSPRADFLAIDHRSEGATSLVELFGRGRPWLGPTWALDTAAAEVEKARPRIWQTGESADWVEWSFRSGEVRFTRTALLLHGRSLAILADQVDGPMTSAALRIAIPEGIKPRSVSGSRAIVLTSSDAKTSAQVVPFGLSQATLSSDRGQFTREGHDLILRRTPQGKRCWLPLLVSWNPARNRRPVSWRVLTVAERSKICPPELAFAARITWDRMETIVIYRSLGRAGLRSFLGYQTKSPFFVGVVSKTGAVEPILALEE